MAIAASTKSLPNEVGISTSVSRRATPSGALDSVDALPEQLGAEAAAAAAFGGEGLAV